MPAIYMHCLVVQGAHHDLKESEACVGMWDFSALQYGGLGSPWFLEYYYDTIMLPFNIAINI